MEVHQGLESLKEEIESEPITLNIDKLPDIKATMLERARMMNILIKSKSYLIG